MHANDPFRKFWLFATPHVLLGRMDALSDYEEDPLTQRLRAMALSTPAGSRRLRPNYAQSVPHVVDGRNSRVPLSGTSQHTREHAANETMKEREVAVNVPVKLPATAAVRALMDACDWSTFLPPGARAPRLTAREISARKRDIEMALRFGVDINGLYEGFTYTFLTCATSSGYPAIVKFLLDRGADPNRCDALGFRPIHTAKVRGDQKIYGLLIRNGADPSLPKEGVCAIYDLAKMEAARADDCVIA